MTDFKNDMIMIYAVAILLLLANCTGFMILPIDEKNITYTRILYSSKPNTSTHLLQDLYSRTFSALRDKNMLNSTTSLPVRRWREARFTKKQYKFESTTTKQNLSNVTKDIFYLNKKSYTHNIFSTHAQNPQTSTSSYIDFYYSDETNDLVTRNSCEKGNCQLKSEKFHPKLQVHNSSLVFFRIKPILKTTKEPTTPTLVKVNSTPKDFFNSSIKQKKLVINDSMSSQKVKLSYSGINVTENFNTESTIKSTTVYDKIKFFELYDKYTRKPSLFKTNNIEFVNNIDDANKITTETKALLDYNVSISNLPKNNKHSKKHITENSYNRNLLYPNGYTMNGTIEQLNSINSYISNNSSVKQSSRAYLYKNELVSWSEYPYAAVYVYEPLQVHCDAVSISAHWLIASGSCLSRLNKSSMFGKSRSAYVAYCGDLWWAPERVTYVKFTGVHPLYHSKDRIRKHLYNIGVIQVVTSMMSACSEWAPVALMSHQFTAERGGSEAIALGWGLDRFDTRYTSTDLPKRSLMIYKNLVFSGCCPGNNGYGRMKRFDDGGLSNVFCLSLPPYSGEEQDAVHGGLLFVNGKLMALYLQEERRPVGEQSAQYTGIWRLIPWVMDTAKEPIETDSVEI